MPWKEAPSRTRGITLQMSGSGRCAHPDATARIPLIASHRIKKLSRLEEPNARQPLGRGPASHHARREVELSEGRNPLFDTHEQCDAVAHRGIIEHKRAEDRSGCAGASIVRVASANGG